MSADSALNRLYDQSVSFRLYADYSNGMTIKELALLSSRSECWVAEHIDAMRLCLTKQISILIAEPQHCQERIWAEQVWD